MKHFLCKVAGCWLSICLLSCGAPSPMLKGTGETATVALQNGVNYEVEIIAVQDSMLLCIGDGAPAAAPASVAARRIMGVRPEKVASLTVAGFRNNRWVIGVVVFQLLPAVGIAVAAGSANVEDPLAVGLVCAIPAALTALAFAGSGEPTPSFDGPLSRQDLEAIRMYARFPGELTPAQVEDLLHSYNQKEITELK